LFRAFGLLAAISYFIDMFFVDAVIPMPFSEGMLLGTTFRFFIDPRGIFFDVCAINFELTGDYSGGS
jgi:hypothetical protein